MKKAIVYTIFGKLEGGLTFHRKAAKLARECCHKSSVDIKYLLWCTYYQHTKAVERLLLKKGTGTLKKGVK